MVKGELNEYEKIKNFIRYTDTVISTLVPSMDRKATVLSVILGKIFIPKRGLEEMKSLGNTVKSSNLDWTIVRILFPVNNDTPSDIKVTFGDKKIKWKISRKNISNKNIKT